MTRSDIYIYTYIILQFRRENCTELDSVSRFSALKLCSPERKYRTECLNSNGTINEVLILTCDCDVLAVPLDSNGTINDVKCY